MKYLKTFEESKIVDYKIGDYVLMNSFIGLDSLSRFLNANIGQIVDIIPNHIRVKYDNVPDNISLYFSSNTRNFEPKLIDEISDNVEDLKIKIASKKYNL